MIKTYSITGMWEPNCCYLYEKRTKEILRLFKKRERNTQACMLIVKPFEHSEKRIREYTDAGKVIVLYEELYTIVVKDHPEYLL